MTKKNLEELCSRFFRDVYDTSVIEDGIDAVFTIIEEFYRNYLEICSRVNAEKGSKK